MTRLAAFFFHASLGPPSAINASVTPLRRGCNRAGLTTVWIENTDATNALKR